MANIFEEVFQPDVVNYLASLVKQQQDMMNDINSLTQQVKTVADNLTALTGILAAMPASEQLAQQAGISGRTPMPLPSLTLPLSPKTLNEMMMSVELKGHVSIEVFNEAITCTAKNYTTLKLTPIYGDVTVFMSPALYSATYYSSDIILVLLVDGANIFGSTGRPYVLSGAGSFEAGPYMFVRQSIELQVYNFSNTNTTIFFKPQFMYIDRVFFDTFYTPILGYDYDVLKSLATIVNGGQVIA